MLALRLSPTAACGYTGPMRARPETVLKTVFGYDSFRPFQQDIIDALVAGADCMAVLPTGAGKSLCYQIPALMLGGLTLVVSPLIALMRDQVAALAAAGVDALFINSSLSPAERELAEERVRAGSVRLVYAAPESLSGGRLLSLLDSVHPRLVAVDEAHCVSEWGHDFRPEYRELSRLRERYPQAVWLAITATATERVRADIASTLGLKAPRLFLGGFDRPNLNISVEPKAGALRRIVAFSLSRADAPGIVYCGSRKKAESVAEALRAAGLAAGAYHAGMSADERTTVQDGFIRDDIRVVSATTAFGLGIDKPDVRYIIHADLPRSLEQYYQEIGRAGRDGQPSECVLLYSRGDVVALKAMMGQSGEDERPGALDRLDAMRAYAESGRCRRAVILEHFGESAPGAPCGACDNCERGDEGQVDVTVQAQKFLSCVKRAGERFGAGHVIDILLGEHTDKVARFGHERLSTFGIGQEFSRSQWNALARALLDAGHLVREPEHKTLLLGRPAVAVLRSESPFFLPAIVAGDPGPAQRISKRTRALQRGNIPGFQAEGDEAGGELFQKLRMLRKELADAKRIPPYVIFPDRTLKEMASIRPASLEELAGIYGVGRTKLANYGQTFLDAINPR